MSENMEHRAGCPGSPVARGRGVAVLAARATGQQTAPALPGRPCLNNLRENTSCEITHFYTDLWFSFLMENPQSALQTRTSCFYNLSAHLGLFSMEITH